MDGKNRKLQIGILTTVILVVSVVAYVSFNFGEQRSVASAAERNTLTLARPLFSTAMASATSFLDQEAGFAIWINATANAPLNLIAAKAVITLTENATSDYVIGSVSLQAVGFSSNDYPHAFVDKSGWIVVYWLRRTPIGKTFPMYVDGSHSWYDKTGHHLNDNLLHYTIDLICQQLSISSSSNYYYDFEFPLATKLEIAIKTSEGLGPGSLTVTYNMKVPSTVNIDEQSYSFYCTRGSSSIYVDTTVVVTTPSSDRYYGDFSPLLNDSIWHVVSTTKGSSFDYGNQYATGCILLLYH